MYIVYLYIMEYVRLSTDYFAGMQYCFIVFIECIGHIIILSGV